MLSREAFVQNGFIGPLRLLTADRAHFFARHFAGAPEQRPVWRKSLATIDPLAYQIATSSVLLDELRDLLGNDIILWGASVVIKQPGEVHRWHCDIESCASSGGHVSVWIGLLNTQQGSALRLVRGSHAFGMPLQELTAREQVSRADRSDELILRLAAEQNDGADIAEPDVTDGEAIFFDGRIWHDAQNALRDEPRLALLLQYARADIPVRVPDFRNLEWPFQFKDNVRPPVLCVSGDADGEANDIVAPPTVRSHRDIVPAAHAIARNLSCKDGTPFMPVSCFEGRTANVDSLECHYSVLMPGYSPHPPHAHLDEEILVVMNGAAELVVPKTKEDEAPQIFAAPAGTAIYYPSFQLHTIRNVSTEPVSYAMLRWKSGTLGERQSLTPQLIQWTWVRKQVRGPLSMTPLLDGPTGFLDKLHAHVTRIQPGAGYAAHRDTHDVAIFLIEGDIAVLGRPIAAPAVVFLPAGCLHDMKAAGAQPAKYLVWELHGHAAEIAPARDALGVNPTPLRDAHALAREMPT